VPVLAGEPSSVSMFPTPASRGLAVQLTGPVRTVAAAAGGFVAGAALLSIVRHRHVRRIAPARQPRRLSRSANRGGPVAEMMEVVSTRSLLVDVHLLGVPGSDR
jgi:hypothetical protein